MYVGLSMKPHIKRPMPKFVGGIRWPQTRACSVSVLEHQALTGILTEQKLISDCRYRVIESSSLVPVLFREVFSHPYISFFHLLVNGFSVIREYGSTLYVGLARAISPTNTNLRLTFLLTRLEEALYEDLAV